MCATQWRLLEYYRQILWNAWSPSLGGRGLGGSGGQGSPFDHYLFSFQASIIISSVINQLPPVLIPLHATHSMQVLFSSRTGLMPEF